MAGYLLKRSKRPYQSHSQKPGKHQRLENSGTIVNSFQPLTIVAKFFILDLCNGRSYASAGDQKHPTKLKFKYVLVQVLVNNQFTKHEHGHGECNTEHPYFKLRILLVVIALSLATKRCEMTREARLFQMPDILLKGTVTHAFSHKNALSRRYQYFCFLLVFLQIDLCDTS